MMLRDIEHLTGRTRLVVAVLVVGCLVASAMPAGEQDEVEDPVRARSRTIYLELAESGRYSDLVELTDAWLDALGAELGSEHPEVLRSLFATGRALLQRGMYSEALGYFDRLVELSTRVDGATSSATLVYVGWLAGAHSKLGHYGRAKVLEEQRVAALVRLSGPEHPDTLAAKSNLAVTLLKLGESSAARRLGDEVLEASGRLLGPEHPDTLIAKSTLAAALRDSGDLAGARRHGAEVLEALTRTVGAEHPETLRARANLAVTLDVSGDLSGARRHEEEVLEIQGRRLGPEHPDTLRAQANLAGTMLAQGDLQDARQRFEEVLEVQRRRLGAEHPETLATSSHLAETLRSLGELPEARRHFAELLEAYARLSGDEHPDTLATTSSLAMTLHDLGEAAVARELLEEVLHVRMRVLGSEHPNTLKTQLNLAVTLQTLGDFPAARHRVETALEGLGRVRGPTHPDTLIAKSNLAAVLLSSGDLSGAGLRYEELLEESTGVLGAEHPSTLQVRSNLAWVLTTLGDFPSARHHYDGVLKARHRLLGAEHPDTLTTEANLALLQSAQGDFSAARQRFEEVLAARSRLWGADHPDTLTVTSNLAVTLSALGDHAGARRRFEEVLTARLRDLGPEHPETLIARANLANALDDLGDFSGARSHGEEALDALVRTLGPEHPDTLTAHANLAGSLQALGDLEGARRRYEEILETRSRRLGPEHPDTLLTLHNLAVTLRDQGDLDGSSRLLERVIDRRGGSVDGYQPRRIAEAQTYFFLGMNQRDLGLRDPISPERLAEAFASFSIGLDALEAQTLRADLSEEVRNQYKARYSTAYRQALMVALERDRPGEALHVLERYRTQSLLDLLRWRRASSVGEMPDVPRHELASIAARYDRLTRQIGDAYPEIDPTLLAEQAQLRRRREVIQGRILEARRAEGDLPQPLRVEAIRRVLDPGTLMLAYSIGEEGRHLFVLDRDGPVEAYPIEATAHQLWLQVGRLLDTDLGGASDTSRDGLSRWFYDQLVAPAADRIAQAERLLIVPDGSLHYLHFAALTQPSEDDPRGWEYLIEHKPIHTVQSATVYAELQSRRPEDETVQPGWQWTGFGDPIYPVATTDASAQNVENPGGRALDMVRATTERGIWDGLTELPNTEREVQEIARQFPKDQAIAYLDRRATEDQAREVLGNTRIAHFAAHGLAHPEQPMDSFLALSLLDGEDLEHNGLLQAWEIVDHLQLDADLVVLSACVTAFGPNRSGEGLISLSRAFQIAGARTVLASLWSVADASTAELMIRFYRHLLSGQSKDEALRSAQLELIRESIPVTNADGEVEPMDYSAPYHWAAFQLIGDWQ